MNRLSFFLMMGSGFFTNAYAACNDGAVICKLSDNRTPPNAAKPAHVEHFGCQGSGLFHIGPCGPIPANLANAQKICNTQYGGISSQTGCSVDWGSVAQKAKEGFDTAKNIISNVAKQVGKVAQEGAEVVEGAAGAVAEGAEVAGAAVAANPELMAVALV
jgi:hypothetical protein